MTKDIYAAWQRQSDLMKLQYVYGAAILLTLVIAGLVGLLSETVARQILVLTWIATVAFVVNLISFALIRLFSDSYSPQPPKKSRSRRRS
jgi:undecaprenyl pyrophosphate phosphatase UppP